MPTPKTAKKTATKAKSSTTATKTKKVASKSAPAKTPAKKVTKSPAKASTAKKASPKAAAKNAVPKTSGKKTTSVNKTAAKKKPASKASAPVKTATNKVAKKAELRLQKTTAKEAAKAVQKSAEPHALKNEITDKVRTLINLSREQGFLTFKDIDKSLPEIATDPEELQNVISIFNNLEIKLLDSAEVEKFKKNQEEKEDENARSTQSDMLDDPVRTYLKQMGQVPLLSREEEVEISKRIEVQKLQHSKGFMPFP